MFKCSFIHDQSIHPFICTFRDPNPGFGSPRVWVSTELHYTAKEYTASFAAGFANAIAYASQYSRRQPFFKNRVLLYKRSRPRSNGVAPRVAVRARPILDSFHCPFEDPK
jgi:hypothetical protein